MACSEMKVIPLTRDTVLVVDAEGLRFVRMFVVSLIVSGWFWCGAFFLIRAIRRGL